MALDARHMQLPIRPSSMPASKVTFSQLRLVSYAGWWRGGKVERRPTLSVVDGTGRPRGRGTPSDSRIPNDKSGPRVGKQRFEGAVEFQRDYGQSRAVSN
jgi:hypothetical protein